MTNELKNPNEVKSIKKTLTKFRKISVDFVLNAKNEDEAKTRGAQITNKLQQVFGAHKCPKGTIFNPNTGFCEPI